jgi:hypothetical protein
VNQTAFQALTAMLNAFPQSATVDRRALLLTFEEDLKAISDLAIVETAQRFRRGEIPDQNKTFAPSIAEFKTAAENQMDLILLRSRPRLAPPPERPRGPLAPFQIRQQRLLAENANRDVLFEGIGNDQWRKLSANREIPVGSKWVAALGIVYGPEKAAQKSAA